MSIRNNLRKTRSHIAFVIGVSVAAGIALSVETGVARSLRPAGGTDAIAISADQTILAPTATLTRQELAYAKTAWAYFEQNTQWDTGLVNSVQNFPSTTIWDQASYLLGLISAQRIGIIDDTEFERRMALALAALSRLPLFDGKLPNKVYDTRTLAMTNYANQPVEQGIGWSALDVARMTVPLNILLYDYPAFSAQAGRILQAWDINAMIRDGVLFGARVDPETGFPERVQEGRLGYEEYGARAVALLGLDTLSAIRVDDFLRLVQVSGQEVAVDSRSYAEFDAHNYVVSEPYILMAVEFGFDRTSQELAHRIYRAQEERFKRTGVLTAVSEDNIDQPPYFIYNTVYSNGRAWNAIAEDGSIHDDKRTVSTKAAFGWDSIYGTAYTAELVAHVLKARGEAGWFSGIYEANGSVNAVATANTNAIILQTLQYKANGPLLAARFGRAEAES